VDRDEYRRTSLENWQTMASGWERRRADVEEATRPVTEWMVEALDPQPGQTVLELAAGPGDTGFTAAPALGDGGRLISSDFSSEMIDVARRRAAELDLGNVEHRVVDAEAIPLGDDSVDGVLCRFGLMLMADPGRALAETRRVLRPGGRLVLAVWSTPERNPWISIAGRILAGLGLTPPQEPGAPGMFVLADHARLRAVVEEAGFVDVRVEDVPLTMEFAGVEEYIVESRETGGMFSRTWRDAPEADRDAIRAGLEEGFARYAGDRGIELPGVAVALAAH
jgi:ubiquinone/menaquinone biosynthesis C-methylase UbiE